MIEAYFSRVRLRRDPDVGTLAPLLFPNVTGERISAVHRMIWSLFADGPDRKRDFLYREAKGQTFFILSSRPPEDRRALFEVDVKPFEPALRNGDILNFSLRANPVVSTHQTRADGKDVVVRRDVVMHALHNVPKGSARAETRPTIIRAASLRWLATQGEKHGFRLKDRPVEAGERGRCEDDDATAGSSIGRRYIVIVDGYETLRLPRGRGDKPVQISIVDFDGQLGVTDATAFSAMLAQGIGKAKAFGCGLMLIRRG
jgi:CRISPR system Cascade subunit CasE